MSDKAQAEAAFLERWRQEEPLYAAWGRFVGSALTGRIAGKVAPTKLEMFLRIPVIPRVKAADSLLQKAFHRNKGYENPYDDIEDKVGLRFVVLLSGDIRVIEDEILNCPHWTATKARDFAEEREERPYEFDYQSVHYVLRSLIPIDHEGLTIPAALPCEIQIRTLLQHAYSELTHDTIYKPSVKATPSLKRAAAKSMALIEATDDYFSQVDEVIKKEVAALNELATLMEKTYTERLGHQAETRRLIPCFWITIGSSPSRSSKRHSTSGSPGKDMWQKGSKRGHQTLRCIAFRAFCWSITLFPLPRAARRRTAL